MGVLNLNNEENSNEKNNENPQSSPQRRKFRRKQKYLYDFVSLYNSKSAIKILEDNSENTKNQIFSEYITRINSKQERKQRVLLVSGN